MKPIRLGIIGAAGRGGYLAHEFHYQVPTAQVVAGMDINDDNLVKLRDDIGPDIFLTKDYHELIAHSEVDAVVVASPDRFHGEQGLAVLEAGKHLLLEKPMAITVGDCDRLLAAHKKAGVIFGLGLCMRYMPLFEKMKEIIDSGQIGEVKAYWCNHYVGRGGEFYFHDWHALRANTTGLMLQKGTHDLDMMHFLTGRYPTRVSAFGGLDYFGGDKPNELHCPDCPENNTCPEVQLEKYPLSSQLCAFRKEVDVEDNQVLIMELEGGIKASYQECHFTPDYHRDHIVIGTKGRLYNSEDYNTITVKMKPRCSLADTVYNIHDTDGTHGGGDPRMCRDFIAAIRENRPMRTDPFSGRMAVAAGFAAHESLRSGGKVVEIKPPL